LVATFAGDEIAERVAEHRGRSVAELVDHVGNVVAEVVEYDSGPGSRGSSDAAGLRSKHTVARANQRGRELIEVSATVSTVGREDHNRGSAAVHLCCRL
jgi:hypothetical protein